MTHDGGVVETQAESLMGTTSPREIEADPLSSDRAVPGGVRRPVIRFAAFPAVDFAVCFSLVFTLAAFLPAAAGHRWYTLVGASLSFALFNLAGLAAFGLYPRRRLGRSPTLAEIPRTFCALTLSTWLFLLAWETVNTSPLSLGQLAVLWLVSTPAIAAARFSLRQATARAFGPERILVIGADTAGQSVVREFLKHFETSAHVVGFFDPERDHMSDEELSTFRVYQGTEDFETVLDDTRATRVVIASPRMDSATAALVVRACDRRGIKVDVVPPLYEMFINARVSAIGGISLLELPELQNSRIDALSKRAFDFCLATTLLIVLAPLLGLVALAIRLDSPGRAIFSQPRVGRYGRVFKMAKFRTMRGEVEGREDLVSSWKGAVTIRPKERFDPRITRIGRLLRITSLDELPQLWNIVRGEMSFVGPRPLPLYEFTEVEGADGRRLEVPPGLTGLWQVLGRSEIGFRERMRLDDLYARNRSFSWDIRLLLETISAVIRRKGAY